MPMANEQLSSSEGSETPDGEVACEQTANTPDQPSQDKRKKTGKRKENGKQQAQSVEGSVGEEKSLQEETQLSHEDASSDSALSSIRLLQHASVATDELCPNSASPRSHGFFC